MGSRSQGGEGNVGFSTWALLSAACTLQLELWRLRWCRVFGWCGVEGFERARAEVDGFSNWWVAVRAIGGAPSGWSQRLAGRFVVAAMDAIDRFGEVNSDRLVLDARRRFLASDVDHRGSQSVDALDPEAKSDDFVAFVVQVPSSWRLEHPLDPVATYALTSWVLTGWDDDVADESILVKSQMLHAGFGSYLLVAPHRAYQVLCQRFGVLVRLSPDKAVPVTQLPMVTVGPAASCRDDEIEGLLALWDRSPENIYFDPAEALTVARIV